MSRSCARERSHGPLCANAQAGIEEVEVDRPIFKALWRRWVNTETGEVILEPIRADFANCAGIEEGVEALRFFPNATQSAAWVQEFEKDRSQAVDALLELYRKMKSGRPADSADRL